MIPRTTAHKSLHRISIRVDQETLDALHTFTTLRNFADMDLKDGYRWTPDNAATVALWRGITDMKQRAENAAARRMFPENEWPEIGHS